MKIQHDIKNETKAQKPKQTKQIGDFIIGKSLGSGTFGKVKLGIHKLTNEKVAIKILQKRKINQTSDIERVNRQMHILKLMRHPNLVQLYQIIQTPSQLFLIMEYMQNGQLFEYIVDKKRIPENQAKRLFSQFIDGIEYIHKIGIAHRDLKPQNIMLNYNKSIKIVDFGLSNIYNAKKKQTLKTPCGSPCYAAPQMIQGERYSGIKVDIWSSGIILFAMLNGYLPFEDEDTNTLYKKVLSGSYEFHDSVSQQGKDLIRNILNNKPNERFTIQQIRNHEWMASSSGRKKSQGIVVGYNKIPVDPEILNKMQAYGQFDKEYVQTCIEANRHNSATVTYYLTMKKYLMEGGSSKFDMGDNNFDRTFIQPTRRKQPRTATGMLIDNFFTKASYNRSTEITQGVAEKRKISSNNAKMSKQMEQNKENIGILMNKKRSKDHSNMIKNSNPRSKEKSKQNLKLALREQSINTMKNSNNVNNHIKPSNKLNISIEKQSDSQAKRARLSASSTTKMQRKNKNMQTINSNKLDNSINYGRIPMTKSIQKTSGRQSSVNTNYRQSIMDNRVTRKYKQQFNQSLVSRSKGKLKSQRQRSRINSTSINQSVAYQPPSYVGFNTTSSQMYTNNNGYVLMNLSKKGKQPDNSTCYVDEYLMRGKKQNQKKQSAMKQLQNQSSKMIKPRKL